MLQWLHPSCFSSSIAITIFFIPALLLLLTAESDGAGGRCSLLFDIIRTCTSHTFQDIIHSLVPSHPDLFITCVKMIGEPGDEAMSYVSQMQFFLNLGLTGMSKEVLHTVKRTSHIGQTKQLHPLPNLFNWRTETLSLKTEAWYLFSNSQVRINDGLHELTITITWF